jgi:Uma2 family endonuclease
MTTPLRIRRAPPLLLEVADSSLADDRGPRGALYPRAGITDYWILNLIDRALEVHRRPVTAAQATGWRYRDITIVRPGASVSPLARPDTVVEVAALLPAPRYDAR